MPNDEKSSPILLHLETQEKAIAILNEEISRLIEAVQHVSRPVNAKLLVSGAVTKLEDLEIFKSPIGLKIDKNNDALFDISDKVRNAISQLDIA